MPPRKERRARTDRKIALQVVAAIVAVAAAISQVAELIDRVLKILYGP